MVGFDLLTPTVIVVVPRFSEAFATVIKHVLPAYPDSVVIALSTCSQESSRYEAVWNATTDRNLHILRQSEETQIDILTTMIGMIAGSARHALGIILADSPDVPHFEPLKRQIWNNTFAESLTTTYPDLQIVEYSDSWKYSPPRIR